MLRSALAGASFLGFALAPQYAVAQNGFAPLPELTEENLLLHLERCSGFYFAFSIVLSESILDTKEPVELASLEALKKRTEDQSDGLLKATVIASTTISGLDDAFAVDRAFKARDGFASKYLKRFFVSGSSISSPFKDDLWSNDTASCSAIVQNIEPLLNELVTK